jgi:hypothetical protein
MSRDGDAHPESSHTVPSTHTSRQDPTSYIDYISLADPQAETIPSAYYDKGDISRGVYEWMQESVHNAEGLRATDKEIQLYTE